VHRAAEIIDHDLAAAAAEEERVGAAEAATSAGDDCDAPVKPQFIRHLEDPSER
jgi:hypothetical protein